MFMKKLIAHSLASGLLLLGLAVPALATDGVIEINQAKIDALGQGSYTITDPGSYRLTSNITFNGASGKAIQVATDGVKIDLNGFAILGTLGPSCSILTTGIYSLNAVTITNGTVGGFGLGIKLGHNSKVDKVFSYGNCGDGIDVGSGTVSNSTVSGNKGYGISITAGGLATGNYIEKNQSQGINIPGGAYSNNMLYENNSSGSQVTNGISMGDNVCNANGANGDNC